MAESLSINSIVQSKLKTWMEAQTLSWTPRVLTGFRRQSAGESLGPMEAAGEVDTVIIECVQTSPAVPLYQIHNCTVNIRVRHDCDRVSEDTHSTRVSDIACLISDIPTFRDALNALPDFNASQIQLQSQTQTSSGKSYETTITVTMQAVGASFN